MATCTLVSHRQSGYTEHNYAKHRECRFFFDDVVFGQKEMVGKRHMLVTVAFKG